MTANSSTEHATSKPGADTPYFHSIAERISELEEIEANLRTLDETLKTIECDQGSASIIVTPTEVTVSIYTPDLTPEVKAVVSDYDWAASTVSFDEESECLVWELESTPKKLLGRQTALKNAGKR